VSSRRHEQAERQAVEQVATDYAKLAGFAVLAIGVILVVAGPWVEWNKHGHQWGWAVLGVFDDLLGLLIVAAIIVANLHVSGSKRS
jgi:uncharacterized YccA/Bax inhibitor family protein